MGVGANSEVFISTLRPEEGGFWFKDWLSALTASSVIGFNLSDANSCHIHLWDMLKGCRDQILRFPVWISSTLQCKCGSAQGLTQADGDQCTGYTRGLAQADIKLKIDAVETDN
ncbi:hypothetical protein Anapl_09389 [Anas platyrhynchos]|uniref:Uncharacterized protein n=1 Tax=Anas platyrhynchos TaxID=8839 RepID=R0LXR1_ANAPL|nr:hypothetical protein Anapl_09389 [Anas platyrhynchos]